MREEAVYALTGSGTANEEASAFVHIGQPRAEGRQHRRVVGVTDRQPFADASSRGRGHRLGADLNLSEECNRSAKIMSTLTVTLAQRLAFSGISPVGFKPEGNEERVVVLNAAKMSHGLHGLED